MDPEEFKTRAKVTFQRGKRGRKPKRAPELSVKEGGEDMQEEEENSPTNQRNKAKPHMPTMVSTQRAQWSTPIVVYPPGMKPQEVNAKNDC